MEFPGFLQRTKHRIEDKWDWVQVDSKAALKSTATDLKLSIQNKASFIAKCIDWTCDTFINLPIQDPAKLSPLQKSFLLATSTVITAFNLGIAYHRPDIVDQVATHASTFASKLLGG